MTKLEQSKSIIENALIRAKAQPCVMFSGGRDSLLTLLLVKEFDAEIPCVMFNQDFSRPQRKRIEFLINELNLEVYSYPPANRYFVPNESGVSLIDEYSFGGFTMPLIRDFEDDQKVCGLELSSARLRHFNFNWSTVFAGSRADDHHYATGGSPFGRKSADVRGGIEFVLPLIDWTRPEVETALFDLAPFARDFYSAETDVLNTGTINACTNCLIGDGREVFCPREKQMITTDKWDRKGMLDAFRKKYAFH